MKNIFSTLFLCSFILLPQSAFAKNERIRGSLYKEHNQVFLKTKGEEGKLVSRKVLISDEFKFALDEVMVSKPNYVFEFEGTIKEDKILTTKVPTVYGGTDDVSGFLTEGANEGELFIGNQPARLGRTKAIYQEKFDELSLNSYLNKHITAQGHYKVIDGEKVYFIEAMLEDNLLSASAISEFSAPKGFDEDPKNYVLKEMVKDHNSQSRVPFRGTLNKLDGKKVKVGDSVLIITLSGRQGDAPGSAGGHFTIGMGEVQKDMTVKGEVFNFYFIGEKEVLAGNTDLISYFGHLIQGQLNYRPTYTLFAYGVSKKKLREVRDILEVENHKVRTVPGLQITPGYNCTTTSTEALNEVGIFGNHRNSLNRIFDVQNLSYLNPFAYGARSSDGEGTLGKIRTVSYVLDEDGENYVPRPAFESFVKNFNSDRILKKMGIKRVDYLFIPQTMSHRQVGGISYDSPITEGKAVIDFNNARNERIANEKRAAKILKERVSTQEEYEWAQEVLDNAPTREEDQAEVKKFLSETID